MKLKIIQHQEFQNYHESFEFEIFYNYTIIIKMTNIMSKYSEQIQFHNHLSIRKKRNDI